MKRIILVVLLALSGCGVGTRSEPAPSINLSGYPPAFREGYSDGCQSARGRTKRDETRYKSDAQYALGWRDGQDLCRAK